MPSDERARAALRGLAGLFDQLSRAVSGNAVAAGLHPVQWSALRYLASVGPRARTVSGLAKFQGTTLGPTSRTVGAIKRKGYIVALPASDDRRSHRLDLTASGRRKLKQDPLKNLEEVLNTLPDTSRQILVECLETILQDLRARRSR